MSDYGDKLFRRLQRINDGLESGTLPGRRCTRCQKDLSEFFFLEPKEIDLCDECEVETRREAYIARWKAAKPPVYDIDQILSVPGRRPWDIVKDLNSRIDPCCPESLLLRPELIVRNFEEFSCFTGHDFGYILGTCDGPRIFLLGLRSIRALGATHLADAMIKIRDYAISRGVPFPDPIPDPWCCDIKIDSNLESELNRLSDELKPYDGMKRGDMERILVEYLAGQIGVLRQRKPKHDCT